MLKHRPVRDDHVCPPLRPDDETLLPQLARHRAAGATMVSINAGCSDVDALLGGNWLRIACRCWHA